VARLGHAFNAMAESIQHHDHQRKAMVSDVAHELRTPLANIKGYLLASEDGVVPLDPALVTSLLEEAGLLERLVVDLQDLALADAGMLRLHPAPRDLTELVEQVVAAHRPAAETAGVSLAGAVTGPAPAIVDGARIRQALGNLVSNAIRFTRRGGKVVVGVRRVGDGYDLTVTDNGTGISAEHLPHLFDRFYRADHSRSRTTGGSGLGLAITKHLVEAHQGTITVTSTLDHGSTFTIHLPPKPSEH
jgi:two-component system sensor histidine kinase BaeS